MLPGNRIAQVVQFMKAWLLAQALTLQTKVDRLSSDLRLSGEWMLGMAPGESLDRGQTSPAGGLVDTILVIGIAGVIGYVILQVGSSTEDTADFTENSAFDNASSSITGGFETAFSLLDVVFIAFMLAIIVGALLGLRRTR